MMEATLAVASVPRILYGGTFDPVHQGHLAVAEAAAAAFDSDIFLIPSADPPHRAPPGADAGQRASMLDLAIKGHPRLHVDRRELRREGPSYSVDTLLDVRTEIGPSAPLVWLLGADAFCNLHRWYRWRDLFTLAHLAIATRPDHPLEGLVPELQAASAGRWASHPAELVRAASGLLLPLDLPPRQEAASELRHRIAAGGHWEDDTPPAVAAYIRIHRLYAGPQTCPPQS
jgi:nicotinate-nucleotide adenylyltransferase